jgi:tRNA(adenine34) deaminase
MNLSDEECMRRALVLARQAQTENEVPVGALVVMNGAIVGEGWNRPIALCDPTAHAEVLALRAAAQHRQSYRLAGATLYVTLEPCPMCLSAMVHARVGRVVFGAWDPRQGAAGSAFDLAASPAFNHALDVFGGVLSQECGQVLKDFFRQRRA